MSEFSARYVLLTPRTQSGSRVVLVGPNILIFHKLTDHLSHLLSRTLLLSFVKYHLPRVSLLRVLRSDYGRMFHFFYFLRVLGSWELAMRMKCVSNLVLFCQNQQRSCWVVLSGESSFGICSSSVTHTLPYSAFQNYGRAEAVSSAAQIPVSV